MRKRIIDAIPPPVSNFDRDCLPLDHLAQVEITSEDEAHPIDGALQLGAETGYWRAETAGEQTIRLIFDQPQKLRHVWLLFEESEIERTQEFLLRWSPDRSQLFKEIVRQQWHFSPQGSVREVEDYGVELSDVRVLELKIVPDISGGEARATLAQLRLSD